MNKQLEEDLERNIARMEALQAASQRLPDLEGIHCIGVSVTTTSIVASCPFDPRLISAHSNALLSAGWGFKREYDRATGALVRVFFDEDAEISIYYDPSNVGSVCGTSLIGYNHTPIYERVCHGGYNG